MKITKEFIEFILNCELTGIQIETNQNGELDIMIKPKGEAEYLSFDIKIVSDEKIKNKHKPLNK